MKLLTFAATALLTAAGAGAAAVNQVPPGQSARTASGAQPSTANADSEATLADERKICRTEKATGSLTRRTRICLTAAQWREVNDRTRRGVDEMTSVASGGKECVIDPAGGCR